MYDYKDYVLSVLYARLDELEKQYGKFSLCNCDFVSVTNDGSSEVVGEILPFGGSRTRVIFLHTFDRCAAVLMYQELSTMVNTLNEGFCVEEE